MVSQFNNLRLLLYLLTNLQLCDLERRKGFGDFGVKYKLGADQRKWDCGKE